MKERRHKIGKDVVITLRHKDRAKTFLKRDHVDYAVLMLAVQDKERNRR